MFVFQVSKVLHPGLLHAATTGICNFKTSNMFAEFFALSILACWVVKRIVQFNILGVETKVTQISFYLSFSRWSFTKNHFKSCQQTGNTVSLIISLTSSPASGQLLYIHKGLLMTASPKLRQPFNYWLYGQFHYLARKNHIPSPHHWTVHKMVWESDQCTFLNLFCPTRRWSWLFLSYWQHITLQI